MVSVGFTCKQINCRFRWYLWVLLKDKLIVGLDGICGFCLKTN